MMKEKRRNNVRKKMMMVWICCILLCSSVVVQGQAAAKKSSKVTYYTTALNRTKGPTIGKYLPDYWLPGTTKVTYKGNAITFYGSFTKSNKKNASFSKKNFVKYGKKTFKVTAKTKYFAQDFERKYPMNKKRAFSNCKRLSGLCVTLKVKNGKVEYMKFT